MRKERERERKSCLERCCSLHNQNRGQKKREREEVQSSKDKLCMTKIVTSRERMPDRESGCDQIAG